MAVQTAPKTIQITDPPFAVSFFGSPRWAWLWLIARVYVGYQWITAGLEKLQTPAWSQTGLALKGFWAGAVAIPAAPARPAITYEWYRAFLQGLLASQSYVWFSKVIIAGEILVGVALILGAFVGVAAFFGGFMNWNFMLAGSASVNPVLFTISIFLILAWKTAGWWGLDRFLLPIMGTPWKPGRVFSKSPVVEPSGKPVQVS
jgi:thiosulfate dehydrogenase (quinone) large subunit